MTLYVPDGRESFVSLFVQLLRPLLNLLDLCREHAHSILVTIYLSELLKWGRGVGGNTEHIIVVQMERVGKGKGERVGSGEARMGDISVYIA